MARKNPFRSTPNDALWGGDVARTHLHQQGVIRLKWQHTAAKMEEDNRKNGTERVAQTPIAHA